MNVRFITAIHCLIYLYKKGKLTKEIALEKLKNLEKYGRYNIDILKDAKELHTSISEVIDMLAEFGIKSPIIYDDYLESLNNI
ncbi:hypothetical protein HYV79_01555 [Candidatus Woesearchaeota archaeon]|nr:hypothetical protein [Candidatus Woesearchaeota archaeon]